MCVVMGNISCLDISIQVMKSSLNENYQIDDMHETEAFDKC